MLGFISNWVAAQPSSFIINSKYQTAKEAQFITGKDSIASMVIQSGEAVAQKSILLPITLTTQYNSHHPYGYNDGSFIQGLPSLILKFTQAVKVSPSDYIMPKKGSEDCFVNIYKDETVILGDAFFKTGMVELAKNGTVSHCRPSKTNYVLNGQETVKDGGDDTVDVDQANKDDPPKHRYYGLFIGCTIGGIVLIIGVIVFFVIRAKRRQRLTRDDPNRSMIHDLSSTNSVTSSSVV